MLLAAGLAASPANSAPTAHGDAGSLEPLVLDLARKGVSMLSLVPAAREDQDLLWATWVEDRGSGPVSHLALIRRHGHSIERIWSARYPDAYEPRITALYGNLPPDVTAILLRYNFGAAYEEATLYALDRNDVVTKIGSVDGEMVNLLPWQDNTIRADGGPVDPTICYGWNVPARTLAERPCR